MDLKRFRRRDFQQLLLGNRPTIRPEQDVHAVNPKSRMLADYRAERDPRGSAPVHNLVNGTRNPQNPEVLGVSRD